MTRLIPLLMLVLALAGCAHGRGGLLNSYVATGFSAEQESVIAEDLANVLAEKFPPGRTTFHLKIAGTRDDLGEKLDAALRSRGFILAAEASAEAPAVAYVLDRLDEGHCYVRLTVAGGLTLTRAYQVQGDTLEPLALAADEGR